MIKINCKVKELKRTDKGNEYVICGTGLDGDNIWVATKNVVPNDVTIDINDEVTIGFYLTKTEKPFICYKILEVKG